MQVTIHPEVAKELEYIIALHQKHGAPNAFKNAPDLVNYVLASVADGSRRPGAWERQLLELMGLVAQSEAHQVYRAHYGEPEQKG